MTTTRLLLTLLLEHGNLDVPTLRSLSLLSKQYPFLKLALDKRCIRDETVVTNVSSFVSFEVLCRRYKDSVPYYLSETGEKVKHGSFVIRTDENKTFVLWGRYQDGKRTGEEWSVHWWEAGYVCARHFILNGKEHGPQYAYHRNGRISSIYTYKKGRMSGLEAIYRENGTTYMSQMWKNSRIVEGTTMYFTPEGNECERACSY